MAFSYTGTISMQTVNRLIQRNADEMRDFKDGLADEKHDHQEDKKRFQKVLRDEQRRMAEAKRQLDQLRRQGQIREADEKHKLDEMAHQKRMNAAQANATLVRVENEERAHNAEEEREHAEEERELSDIKQGVIAIVVVVCLLLVIGMVILYLLCTQRGLDGQGDLRMALLAGADRFPELPWPGRMTRVRQNPELLELQQALMEERRVLTPAARRRRWNEHIRQWHPDHAEPDKKQLAHEVTQFLIEHKPWYVEGA